MAKQNSARDIHGLLSEELILSFLRLYLDELREAQYSDDGQLLLFQDRGPIRTPMDADQYEVMHPNQLADWVPVSKGIHGPKGCDFEIKTMRDQQEDQHFKNRQEMTVLYDVILPSGVRYERANGYEREKMPNLGTLTCLGRYLTKLDLAEKPDRAKLEKAPAEVVDSERQWRQARRFYRAYLFDLSKVKAELVELGPLGDLIYLLITKFAGRGYELGREVKLAELIKHQATITKSHNSAKGRKKGLRNRISIDADHRKRVEQKFVDWLNSEIAKGIVPQSHTKAGICRFAIRNWPKEGFEGVSPKLRSVQIYPPSETTLLKKLTRLGDRIKYGHPLAPARPIRTRTASGKMPKG